MCRHLGYVGPDIRLADVVLAGPHSLEVQSYRARELLQGHVAADGFGVAWYRDEAGKTPANYRSLLPIWADRSFHSLAPRVFGHTIVANVRNATEVGTNDLSNVHPFADGSFVFSQNGFLEDFPRTFMRPLRDRLSDAQYAALGGVTDAETLFRLILTRHAEGRTLRAALADTAREVMGLAAERGKEVQFNVILTDGGELLATRASNRGTSNSLYTLTRGRAYPEAALVASEPFDDDPAWAPVPEGHLVVLHAGEPPALHPLDA